jgi:hypothetical protein
MIDYQHTAGFLDRALDDPQGASVPLPHFNATGDLPPGIYQASLLATIERFGRANVRRQIMAYRLERIYQMASATGHLARFIVFGSFITSKPEPNDVDVFMLMEDTFEYDQLSNEAKFLFDHTTAQDHFGGSVFWIRRLAALDGEQATIEYWQGKRNGGLRGIVEIVEERL